MSKKDTCAVIVAAGSSTRFGGKDKLFASIEGQTVLMRSVIAFQNNTDTDGIVIVTREDLIFPVTELCRASGISKCISVVEGGKCREESVINGLSAAEGYRTVLVHDAARPLVSDELISAVVSAAAEYGAAIPVIPVKDTVKLLSGDGFVISTPERASLFAAQTPQGFLLSMYKNALSVWTGELDGVTDDASLFENAGYRVKTVTGQRSNIKITTSEDIAAAEAFIRTGEAK